MKPSGMEPKKIPPAVSRYFRSLGTRHKIGTSRARELAAKRWENVRKQQPTKTHES